MLCWWSCIVAGHCPSSFRVEIKELVVVRLAAAVHFHLGGGGGTRSHRALALLQMSAAAGGAARCAGARVPMAQGLTIGAT